MTSDFSSLLFGFLNVLTGGDVYITAVSDEAVAGAVQTFEGVVASFLNDFRVEAGKYALSLSARLELYQAEVTDTSIALLNDVMRLVDALHISVWFGVSSILISAASIVFITRYHYRDSRRDREELKEVLVAVNQLLGLIHQKLSEGKVHESE